MNPWIAGKILPCAPMPSGKLNSITRKFVFTICPPPLKSTRVLSQNLHVTFLDLLHTKRIFVALEYFSNSKKLPQLEYLATDLGYSSAHYFYCVFKRYVGLTPSEVWHLMSA